MRRCEWVLVQIVEGMAMSLEVPGKSNGDFNWMQRRPANAAFNMWHMLPVACERLGLAQECLGNCGARSGAPVQGSSVIAAV